METKRNYLRNCKYCNKEFVTDNKNKFCCCWGCEVEIKDKDLK